MHIALQGFQDPLTLSLSPRGERTLLRAQHMYFEAVPCSTVPSPLGEKDRMRGVLELITRVC
jgi:hypothetical protein